jgi:predicted GH43/DUF377 family glycosyl hydrolase
VPHLSGAKANIWLSFSPDLHNWGDHAMLLEARDGAWWDAGKIGLSPQPIETREGWLMIYHGVRNTPAGALYRVGLALLDLEDPRRVLRRGGEWVIGGTAVTGGGRHSTSFPVALCSSRLWRVARLLRRRRCASGS